MVCLQLSTLLLVILIALSSCQDDIRKPPNIVDPNRPTTFYYSGSSKVEVKCKAEGTPPPTYKWTKNGNPIIPDNLVKYDSTLGTLTIPDFTKREEGTYMCIASNVFDNAGGRVTASSFAPPVKLYQTRVEKFLDAEDSRQQVTEYEYALLKCAHKGEVVGSDINTNWYESEKSKDVSMDAGRLFIDQGGNLHFSYTLARDATSNFIYLCGISSTSDKLIRLGNANYLSVTDVPSPSAIKPQLQYSNSGVKGLRFSTARLECVFSGYDPSAPHVPIIQWFDDSGREITSNTAKYTLSEDRRALTITSLQEEDERNYFCQAKNSAGVSEKMLVFLNVTSAPIFHPNGAPKDQTVIENVDVKFNCDARSASNEAPPHSPIWYLNGLKMGQHTDPTKYQLSNGNKTLTVMKVKKATDILCVQCEVTNHEDTTWADACLNVILPIKIERAPEPRQEIDHGDVVDLTVTASTDPAMTLNYRWEFNNQTYSGSDAPPFVIFDPISMKANINTSLLTEGEYNTVGGTYRRLIFHTYQTEAVEVLVVLKDKPGDAISTPGTSPLVTTPHPSSSSVRTESTEVVPPTPSFFRHDFECHQTFMRVYIQNSLVPNAELTMKDPGCRLQDNGTHYVISFLYDMCGTSLTSYTDHVNVQNQITVHTILSNVSGVEFVPDYIIPLQCSVNRTRSIHSAFQVVTRDPMDEHDRMASDFDIKEYRSELYQDEITEYPVLIPFNREIFFDLVLSNNQTNSGISVTKCEATPSSNPNDATRLTLITNGCSASPAVKVQGRYRIDHFRFSVQAFHFSGSINQNNTVYVHCNVSICQPGTCTTVCSRNIRRRRSSRHDVTLTSGTHIVASEVN